MMPTVTLPIVGSIPLWQAAVGLVVGGILGWQAALAVARLVLGWLARKAYQATLKHGLIAMLLSSGAGLGVHHGGLTGTVVDLLTGIVPLLLVAEVAVA